MPDFNGLGKDNCKTRRETLHFWEFGAPYIRFDGRFPSNSSSRAADSTNKAYSGPHMVTYVIVVNLSTQRIDKKYTNSKSYISHF